MLGEKKKKNQVAFSLKLFASKYLYRAGESPRQCRRHCMGDLRASIDHKSGSREALKVQVSHNQTLRIRQIGAGSGRKHSMHLVRYWVTLFPRYTSQHRHQINTSYASALSPISHFFRSLLKDLATVQCCEEN